MKIGVAGLGRMGSVMVERLLAAGFAVTVWNRSPDKAAALVAKGAVLAGSPRALAEICDIVLTVVKDAPAVEAVYFGPDGLCSAPGAGRLLVDISTVAAETHVALASRIAAHGDRFLEAPVGGSILVAREGRLLCFAAGAAEDLETVRPALAAFCRRIDLVGPVGAGARLKMAVNLPLLVYWQALGEALSLLEDGGYDPEWIIDLLSESSGGPNVLKVRGPSIAKALNNEAIATTATVDTLRKDLDLMLRGAEARGLTSPVVAATLATFTEAQRRGLGALDCSAFPAYWIRQGNRPAGDAKP